SRAQSSYQAAFAIEPGFAHPLLSCKLRHNWVNLLFHMGRSDEAESVCYEWLHLSIRSQYPDQQAAALNYLALLAGQRGHRELQLSQLNQALAQVDFSQHPQFYCQCLVNRAQVYYELKKFPAAQLEAETAFQLCERRSEALLGASASLLLSRVYRDRPRPD